MNNQDTQDLADRLWDKFSLNLGEGIIYMSKPCFTQAIEEIISKPNDTPPCTLKESTSKTTSVLIQ